MMLATTMVDTVLPNVKAVDGTDLCARLRAGRYALVWWHPQALTPAACKTCGGAIQEPVQLLMDIHAAGCDIVGLTYDRPERVMRYQQDIGLEYPILSVDEDAARAHGVAKVPGEPWPSIPHRIAFLVDEHGQIINRYEVHDVNAFLRTVLGDVKAGPPESEWKPVKKGFFAGLLSR